ncbi:response regulator transcription factor [Cohnella sp. WQ 127256]|uniref:response regulator transcription factor n=1 Tax=Cohnella sp. WQ 127256 TaxID=2938790 RepID=UPI0021196339|nr:response regulator transcription factor [Cohnella sp. WQ 127256]
MIQIGIAEDQALIRESLAIVLALESDFEISWTAETGVEAMVLTEQVAPDIILMDLRMPEMDGATAIRRIRRMKLKSQMIVLTTFHHEEWLMDAIDAGAVACFMKEIPPDLLITAIRAIYHNNWDPDLWTKDWRRYAPEIQFRAHLGTNQTKDNQENLTSRDIDIWRKLCSGATNKEIAADLHLSEGTVKNYVSILYAKLGVRHRAEVVNLARDRIF